MALYDGFFDAVLDEESYQHDREYNSGDFTEYFGEFIGSGVCIHGNDNSMKVSWDGSAAVIAPGYLFIDGYWLKNTADYSVPISGAGVYAIAAYLNSNARRIDIVTRAKADPEEYPDCLVLAYVTIDDAGAGAAEDTRYNVDICGVIDSAGGLSSKVEYAINYINNEIDAKLAEAEAAIAAQALLLDAKIQEVNTLVEKLSPPPIGTVKFSASGEIEEGWLRCDGSFISETEYPELVAALGKLTPSGDKFSVLSEGEIGTAISNCVLYNGRLWVYSHSAGKLYGVDATGAAAIKEIALSSESAYFADFITPTAGAPLALSIVPHTDGTGARLFLTQIIKTTYTRTAFTNYAWMAYFLIFQAEFTGEEDTLAMTVPFSDITKTFLSSTSELFYYPSFDGNLCVPYVVSHSGSGVETYRCAIGYRYRTQSSGTAGALEGVGELRWTDSGTAFTLATCAGTNVDVSNARWDYQRLAYSSKNKDELFWVDFVYATNTTKLYSIDSTPGGVFSLPAQNMTPQGTFVSRETFLPLSIAGGSRVLAAFDLSNFPSASYISADIGTVTPGLTLPSAARLFYDGGAYLWGKDIFLIFVGTGIIFSRTLEAEDFGYLDTTSVLGTITQFGFLGYSQDENTLYIAGQDTANTVKVAKMELNTLYDYANDGAWLPLIASDGIPAYIKALEVETAAAEGE